MTGYNSATDPSLLLWYNSEKARVAAAALAEAPVYDSLVASMPPGQSGSTRRRRTAWRSALPRATPPTSDRGSEGGHLTAGAHGFTVPAKALSKYYVITAEAHAQSQIGLQFSPEGFGFARAALVQLGTLANCAFPEARTKSVVLTDDRGTSRSTSRPPTTCSISFSAATSSTSRSTRWPGKPRTRRS